MIRLNPTIHLWWKQRRKSDNQRPAASSVVLFIIFCVVWCYFTLQVPRDLIKLYAQTELNPSGPCRLPELDPWDPVVLPFVSVPKERLKCKAFQPNLTFIDPEGYLKLNIAEMKRAGYSSDSLECKYREFTHNSGVDDDTQKFQQWQPLIDSAKLNNDFVEIECRAGVIKRVVYSYHWSTIAPRTSFKLHGNPEVTFKKVTPDADRPRLSVVILGIDSMSRSNFIRQMPKTYEYLMNNLHSVEFKGHSKVGDNTYINMLAMLTGKRVWNTSEFGAEIFDKLYMFYDGWADYAWDNFTREGYATLFTEDRPDINNFNYKGYLYGFKYPPVTHYHRPFWTAMWWTSLHRRSSAYCYDQVPEHQIQLNYLSDFMRKYISQYLRFFGFFWNQNLSHEVLNKIGVADVDYLRFLKSTTKYLNETILFTLSDHGHRYATIRETVAGRLEARLPFLSITVPDWFRKRFPKVMQNLHTNSKKLTSQFDIYETLKEIVQGDYGAIQTEESPESADQRAFSLFRPISVNRRCFTSHIPEEYCVCSQEIQLRPNSSPSVALAASALVSQINVLLSKENGKCAELSLKRITDSSMFLPNQKTIKDPQTGFKIPSKGFFVNYRVTVEVNPSDALVEAVIKHDIDKDQFVLNGDIERNNAYGNTSLCVADRLLRKLCYCV